MQKADYGPDAQCALRSVEISSPPVRLRSAADDFASALAADAVRLVAALRAQHEARTAGKVASAAFERLEALALALNALLRSPLAPRRVHAALSDALYGTLIEKRAPLPLLIVLASSTARAELSSFLAVAQTFADHGFETAPQLLVVRWENLIEAHQLHAGARRAAFETCLDELRIAVRDAGIRTQITPLNIAVAPNLRDVDAPADFLEVFRDVERLAEPRAGAENDPAFSRLAQNLNWITGFYARQHSLSYLGPTQPLLDLAIRAGIGRRAAAIAGGAPALLLASELNQRFLACYGPTLPIANIALNQAYRVPASRLSA